MDGVNVPARIYRIKTQVTEHGGAINPETTVTEMLRSGSLAYYLVKTTGLQVLRQESPFSGYESFINNPEYIDWPKVLLTLGSSSSVVATSWGTDIWIHQYG